MFECGTCGKGFPAGWTARKNHCNATGHSPPEFECDVCDEYFDDNWDRSQHMHDRYHLPDDWHECAVCIEVFPTEAEVAHHEVHCHLYCSECGRTFKNLNNIQQHLNSRIHRGQEILCPFCKQRYTTAAGMTHHLENGGCPKAPFLGRDQIYKLVRSKDPNGLISKKLIGWEDASPDHYEASDRAWNGRYWECYFCHREFGSLQSLNQHLASPAHQQSLYHCPNRRCGKDFKTLAAIINHLESETCGAMRFETVQRSITNIVSSDRMIKFR